MSVSGRTVRLLLGYSPCRKSKKHCKLLQTIDAASGEQVTYQYDALNRLLHAETASSAWGETYQYDRFGNLTVKMPTKGYAPALAAMYDASTNRQMGVGYDANGNQLVGMWDVENRLVSQTAPDGSTVQWFYDPWGKRVGKVSTAYDQITQDMDTTYEYTLYGITGQRLATVACVVSRTPIPCNMAWSNVYFNGRVLMSNGSPVGVDRLGSVRGGIGGWQMKYWPYGEEEGNPTTADNQDKFATYYRDWPGQDYADQRYYDSTKGRFWTPDPGGSANLSDPGSWNKYAYAGGDPVNFNDPAGAAECYVGGPASCTVTVIASAPPAPPAPEPPDPGFLSQDFMDLMRPPSSTSSSSPCLGGQWINGVCTTPAMLATPTPQLPTQNHATLWPAAKGSLLGAAKFIGTMTFSEDCWKGVGSITNSRGGGPSQAQLHALAGRLQFYDGFTDTRTSGTFLTDQGAQAISPYRSTSQYWRPSYVTGLFQPGYGGATQLEADVLHEMLHNFGYTDGQVQLYSRA